MGLWPTFESWICKAALSIFSRKCSCLLFCGIFCTNRSYQLRLLCESSWCESGKLFLECGKALEWGSGLCFPFPLTRWEDSQPLTILPRSCWEKQGCRGVTAPSPSGNRAHHRGLGKGMIPVQEGAGAVAVLCAQHWAWLEDKTVTGVKNTAQEAQRACPLARGFFKYQGQLSKVLCFNFSLVWHGNILHAIKKANKGLAPSFKVGAGRNYKTVPIPSS